MLVCVPSGACNRKSRTRTLESIRMGFANSCDADKVAVVTDVMPAGPTPPVINALKRLVSALAGHCAAVAETAIHTPKLLVTRWPIVTLSPEPPVAPLGSG